MHFPPLTGWNFANFTQVRKQSNGKHQLALLDHGLYIEEHDDFREQYCRLWKAIFLLDTDTMAEICEQWGIKYVVTSTFSARGLFRMCTCLQTTVCNKCDSELWWLNQMSWRVLLARTVL